MTLISLSSQSLLLAASAGVLTSGGQPSLPSSHREAPFVTEHPKVDATDFYMFTSYEPGRSDFVTLVANYLPLQDAYGGPNYFTLDPEATYDIHVDNNGDAVEDITFRFEFKSRLKDIALDIGPSGNTKSVSVPLRNVGPILTNDTSALNELESYTVTVISGAVGTGQPTGTLLANANNGNTQFNKPVDNIGLKSIPNYEAYAAARKYNVLLPDGSVGRMFVGQRKDPFVVNLGEVFDLVNTNPLGPINGENDDLADANVTSLILEIPKSFLFPSGGGNRIIGAWTAARLPEWRQLRATPSFDQPERISLQLQQVSRLAMPLVNEVVIGLKDKNLFNASHPTGDGQFLDYVTHPTFPALLEALFGVTAPTLFPRADLIQVFLTGVPGLNANGSTAEMMRLNLDIPPTPAAQQSNLGVLGGDLAGYPNGRRPGDDVVDMSLRVVMGVLLDQSVAPSGQLPYTDGAFVDASFFDATFPYLRTPLAGSPNN